MRKLRIVFLLCLFVLPAVVFSQDKPTYVYCEIVGQGKLFTTKINIVLDFGQHMKVIDNRLRDAQGNVREFNSMIDALNFMAKQRWEFVQAYTVTTSNDYSEYHYLIKKKFEYLDEEEKKMFLKEYK